jgi:hypothetical protein
MREGALGGFFVRVNGRLVYLLLVCFAEFDNDIVQKPEQYIFRSYIPIVSTVGDESNGRINILSDLFPMDFRDG